MASLKGDVHTIIRDWMGGSYSQEHAEATAQLNAKALGKVQAIDDILEQVITIGRNTGKEEVE